MAKKNKSGAFILFAIATALLCGGWLMKSFPVFIFGALAPLFALADNAGKEERFWNLAELILLALAIGLMAAHVFEFRFLVASIAQGILLTLAFLAYSFANYRLGGWVGKYAIVLFWLAVEFFLLQLPWRDDVIYLGDSLILWPDWIKWTQYTGYLGTTLWILVTNLFLYLAIFGEGKINRFFLTMTFLTITGPILFSYWQNGKSILRHDMIGLYDHSVASGQENYVRMGEFIPGIAAGISVLVLIVAGLTNKSDQ